LLKLEKTILDELNNPYSDLSRDTMRTQKLIFQANAPNLNLHTWIRIRMFTRILKTRGQCRWLCYLLFSPVLDRSYVLTRNQLLFTILSNWKKFSEEVLAYLTISQEPTQKFSRVTLSQYSNPQSTSISALKGICVLEGEYGARLNYLKSFTNWQNYTLAKIILWNTSYALLLIKQSPILRSSTSLEKFLENFPDFLDLLKSRETLDVVFHPDCGKTLDQRFNDGSLKSPDVIHDVEIWHQRFIVKNKTWVLIDSTCSPQLDFVAGHWQFLEQEKVRISTASLVVPRSANRVTLDRAILLMGRVDENWYHLLLDTFPRYLQFQKLDADIPVLVRADLPRSSINFLKKVISHRLIFVKPEDLISVNSLYFVAGRSTVYDSETIADHLRVAFSPLSLIKTRELILKQLGLHITTDLSNQIYLKRNSRYRNLVNQNAVASKLQKSGYFVIQPDEKFFQDQFQIFSEAKHIVSPGGASLANIIFMKTGSRVTAIRSWRGSDLKLWKKLAEACDIEFDEIIGIPTYFGRNSLTREHSNFYVPIQWIRKLLEI